MKFGEMPDGTAVDRITLQGGGLTMQVLTYGAVVQDLRLAGHAAPLVLGFDSFAPYLTHSPYFGAIAGRCANRIRDGHLEIDGQTFQLDRNFQDTHTLHGGAISMGKRVWTITDQSPDSVTLALHLADGEMGFPGNMDVTARYVLLPDGVFDITMTAETDAPTLCNLAHHSYFTLSGEPTISDHLLEVAAESFLEVDAGMIPTGRQTPVAGTSFDFRTPRLLSQAHPVDHNFCVAPARGPLQQVGTLTSPTSGLSMKILTTEPGLQVYDGAKIDIPLPGLTGTPMGPHAGLALEPQVWPDAHHHPHFPQAVLRPGETYRQQTQFIFSRAG